MPSTEIDISASLQRLPLFHQAGDSVIERIAQGSQIVQCQRGETLFQRGDPCVGFHLVLAGMIKLAFVSPQGHEKVVEIVQPGHSFGEALMFTGQPYIVYAQALARATLVHVSRRTIEQEIGQDTQLAFRMIAGLSRRLHILVQDVEALSLRSGAQRVIGYLLRDIDGETVPGDGPIRIKLDTSKSVIASRLSLTPEHFSRVLHDLGEEGLLSVDGAEITVLDLERMRNHLLN